MDESRDLDTNKGFVRIAFELPHDTQSEPSWERLWAKPLNDGVYEIDNVPWYTTTVNLGDVVSAETRSNRLVFRALVRPSGHSHFRSSS